MQNTVAPFGRQQFDVAAGQEVAVFTRGQAQLYQLVGYPQHPNQRSLVATVTNGKYVSSAFSAAATLVLEAPGGRDVSWEIGNSPVVGSAYDQCIQPAPGALDSTGTLTAALMTGQIVTSSTAAAVTGTMDTGTNLDASGLFNVDDSFDWSVINTGGTNSFTVAAGSGNTLVGSGVVANSTSGRFRTRKTAANTFVTYRLS